MKASDFLSPDERRLVEQTIAESERLTSAEIRVHLETSYSGDILDRAATIFARLKMHRTKLRNGVLIFLGIKNKKFAIIGDIGINQLVHDDFWNSTRTIMESHFRNSEFGKGLSEGVRLAGEVLGKHFPHQQDDRNELSNDITFDSSE